MFQIEKEARVKKTIQMNKTLWETLKDLASEYGLSVNALVVQCCEFALEHLGTQEEKP